MVLFESAVAKNPFKYANIPKKILKFFRSHWKFLEVSTSFQKLPELSKNVAGFFRSFANFKKFKGIFKTCFSLFKIFRNFLNLFFLNRFSRFLRNDGLYLEHETNRAREWQWMYPPLDSYAIESIDQVDVSPLPAWVPYWFFSFWISF